jgi:tRNA threonylcarbamoyladenosine dehydratase
MDGEGQRMTDAVQVFGDDRESQAQLDALLADPHISVRDTLADDLEDLFKLHFPFINPASPEYLITRARYADHYPWQEPALSSGGDWFYFPWRRTLVRLPDEPRYQELRTARNLFLVTRQEQADYYASHVAFAGLSVGSSALNTLVLNGGAKTVSIADPDVLATVNLNRLNASVCDLGVSKVTLARRRVLELNPYAVVHSYPGVDDANLAAFLGGSEPVNALVEEMDELRLKAVVRFAARDRGIPVVMATDDGDSALLDVERFDLEPDRPLFHGTVPEDVLRNIPLEPSPAQRVTIASAIVGPNISTRTQNSMQLVGNQIPTWPQLATAAAVSGAAVTYAVRRIVTGQDMPSGRYRVCLDAALDTDFGTSEALAQRVLNTADFERGLELIFGG